jgi:hypothetical protein
LIYYTLTNESLMSSRLLVVGVTALLIVVSVLVVVSGVPSVPSTRTALGPAVTPAAGPITVVPVDQSNATNTLFTPGGSTGRVYFTIHDPSLDDQVTVNIFDSNATRDGLTSPVMTWDVNLSKGAYWSTLTGLEYTLPDLTYGGTWNVTASGPLGGFASTGFLVQTFEVSMISSPSVILAGHPGSVQFYVIGVPSGAPYTQVTSVTLTGTYYDGTTAAYAPLTLNVTSFGAGATSGSASFVLPVNASHAGYVFIDAEANATYAGTYTVYDDVESDIGNFLSASYSVQCTCVGNTISANSIVTLTVTTSMQSYERLNAPGVGVTFSFWNGTNRVANSSIPGNPPASVTTSLNGVATILFEASPTVFSTSAIDQVNISVIGVPSVAGSAPVYYNFTYPFLVTGSATAGATLVASFGAPLYFGGDTGTVTWQVLPANGGTTSGWSGLLYELAADYSDNYNVFASGPLSGLSGTITFTTPLNFTGEVVLGIEAHNQSNVIVDEIETEAAPAQIVLSPSETEYKAGDTVRFTVQTYGSLFANATLYETVTSPSGSLLSTGVVTDDTFAFTLPSGTLPAYVEAEVRAQASSVGTFATATYELYESAGISVNVGISTVSQYSDGSFQPGQTLTVTWSESTYGPGQASLSYWVELWDANGWYGEAAPVAQVLTGATSGSFSYTIPSGSTAGTQSLWVSVDSATSCSSYCYATGEVSYQVNPSPSALNYELGAGSGLTVGWLILLVFIALIAIVLFLVIRRGRSPKAPKSPPAAEWKEPEAPSSTGGAPPSSSPPPPPSPPSAEAPPPETT